MAKSVAFEMFSGRAVTPKKPRVKKSKGPLLDPPEDLIGIDVDPGLYELTDLFYAYYKYQNENCLSEYSQVASVDLKNSKVVTETKTIARFPALRRIQALLSGSRPFLSGKGIAKHKPNVSLGYFRLILDYMRLPFKSLFTDSDWVKVRVNKRLYDIQKLSKAEREALKLQAATNPNLVSNKEVGEDISDAFVNVLKLSKDVSACIDRLPTRVLMDGVAFLVHSDLDWRPTLVDAIDMVTEPQATCDPATWSTFFIIKKMTAAEVVRKIKKPGPYWNAEALRWALENAANERGILGNTGHYGSDSGDTANVIGENFAIQSFYREKGSRYTNIGSYYGNMLVAEAYYTNKQGKINKAIFFPSNDFRGVDAAERKARQQFLADPRSATRRDELERLKELEKADILFHRENVFASMEDAVTVIPFDRSEPSLERQRGPGHELFSPIECLMRIDSGILNYANLMSVAFFKNRTQGTSASDLQDLEIGFRGDMIDLGDRDFVQSYIQGDLNALTGVRRLLLQHVFGKGYLGGLDGAEMNENGRGGQLANLRLVRDGRVHKHFIEDFAKGLKEGFTKIFIKIVDLIKNEIQLKDDTLVKKLFYETLVDLHGHPSTLLEYEEEDILPDTKLPYWLELEAVRNGASHFGAAEMVLYSEIKNVFGDGLDQQSLQALNRMGIRSMLGSQDSFDILGDPKDQLMTDKDQLYRARMETLALMGSVDSGAVNFESLPVLESKDDHVAHLSQEHNVKAAEIIKRLSENEVTPAILQEMSEEALESRTNLILQLGALSNHIMLHQAQLERFGAKRPDINKLKEQTNSIIQASEGLMNSLQINLRVLDEKRQEQMLRMQNLSPENEAEKMKQEKELLQLQAKREETSNKLALANKIADQRQSQHIDKQLTRARDRELKRVVEERNAELKRQEIETQARIAAQQAKEKANGASPSR